MREGSEPKYPEPTEFIAIKKSEYENLKSTITKLLEYMKLIQDWSDCYCMTEEESSKPGGITCPTCIANQALEE